MVSISSAPRHPCLATSHLYSPFSLHVRSSSFCVVRDFSDPSLSVQMSSTRSCSLHGCPSVSRNEPKDSDGVRAGLGTRWVLQTELCVCVATVCPLKTFPLPNVTLSEDGCCKLSQSTDFSHKNLNRTSDRRATSQEIGCFHGDQNTRNLNLFTLLSPPFLVSCSRVPVPLGRVREGTVSGRGRCPGGASGASTAVLSPCSPPAWGQRCATLLGPRGASTGRSCRGVRW